ncbi:MAG: RnfABCDGE type electron transport complex subunit D [Rhodospirillaceae bacterium]
MESSCNREPFIRWNDARHFQLLAQGVLLVGIASRLDFGPSPSACLLLTAGALITQIAGSCFYRLPRLDLRSALVTGLSLTLLLRADVWWVYPLAGALAIASKFVIRMRGRHLYNPSNFAIVTLLLLSDHVWISPGQWGDSLWILALLTLLSCQVLQKVGRLDIALFFLAGHAFLLSGRTLWLQDPWAIPFHQLQNGNLLLFSFFMITDPKTTPAGRSGRLLYALIVAALSYWLAFFEGVYPALLYGLALLSPTVPLLDYWFPPGSGFIRTRPVLQHAG